MKTINSILCIAAVSMFSCTVEKTESGELPEIDVDVQAESGELPEYNVDWAKVNVGTRTKTVKVPKVMVVMEEEEVEVPYLEVDLPNSAGEVEERTIRVEAEVSEYMHELEIQKVYATGNKLIVISKMEKSTDALQDKRVRVSDQIILNAPDNLTVKHYIIGDKPEGGFNNDYRYYKQESDISAKIAEAKLIYEG
ncbi:MAG: hypothetical protein AAF843_00060 [Bacteroidota bacterium]